MPSYRNPEPELVARFYAAKLTRYDYATIQSAIAEFNAAFEAANTAWYAMWDALKADPATVNADLLGREDTYYQVRPELAAWYNRLHSSYAIDGGTGEWCIDYPTLRAGEREPWPVREWQTVAARHRRIAREINKALANWPAVKIAA